jgi:hypothetical protein
LKATNQPFAREFKMKARHFEFICIPMLLLLASIQAHALQNPVVPGPNQAVAAVPQVNPLAGLKNALRQSGAPVLTPDEETKIKTLVQDFHTVLKPEAPGDALQAAHREFDTAILTGNPAAAVAQATIWINSQSARELTRMKAQADFAVAIIKMLRENNQADPLLRWMGTNGIVNLAMSLTGIPLLSR